VGKKKIVPTNSTIVNMEINKCTINMKECTHGTQLHIEKFSRIISRSGLPDFVDTIYQKGEKLYQMTAKLPNGYKIYQHFPFQGPP
jgi:hypothetical protein